MEVRVGKEIRFAAAHRLMHHKGACKNLHGHNYKVILFCSDDHREVDKRETAMVKDFSEIKETVGVWIMETWDHTLILNREDVKLIDFAKTSKLKVCELQGDPTAENMCLYLLEYFPSLSAVTVYETDSSSASVVREV